MATAEDIKNLAETLKKSGLAASIQDAIKRAKQMLEKKGEEKTEEPKKIDETQVTLTEIEKKEEKPEKKTEEEKLKKEEVFSTTTTEKEQEKEKKKLDYSAEKKVSLSKIFDVNKNS